jgi:hypothetical protein
MCRVSEKGSGHIAAGVCEVLASTGHGATHAVTGDSVCTLAFVNINWMQLPPSASVVSLLVNSHRQVHPADQF